jgi:arabinan endo-1,5-alpha-L-arabinosidase
VLPKETPSPIPYPFKSPATAWWKAVPIRTYLWIVKRIQAGEEHYTPYTSTDGVTWVRGGTWPHELGSDASIGLVTMGGSGFTAEFDYLRVYKLK